MKTSNNKCNIKIHLMIVVSNSQINLAVAIGLWRQF